MNFATGTLDRQIKTRWNAATRIVLDRADPCRTSGVYGLYYIGKSPLYLPISRTGIPIYVGHTGDLAARTKNHANSCDAVGLVASDFELVTVAMPGRLRKYAEDFFIEKFDPLWNRSWLSGFGSKDQGELRAESQRPTAFDRLHPGRPWAKTTVQDQLLVKRVKEVLAAEVDRVAA